MEYMDLGPDDDIDEVRKYVADVADLNKSLKSSLKASMALAGNDRSESLRKTREAHNQRQDKLLEKWPVFHAFVYARHKKQIEDHGRRKAERIRREGKRPE